MRALWCRLESVSARNLGEDEDMGGQLEFDADLLITACSDDSFDAGVSITTVLEPLAGDGAPVKPAVYEGGEYQYDFRWRGRGDERSIVAAIVIDNVPSQANRIEAALCRSRKALGLPELVLDLQGVAGLPVHLPRSISSFSFPHRNADAYLRDAALGDVPFPKTDIGRSILVGTVDEPSALMAWLPQALLFGFWQSHLGKKGPQSKLARSWVSEIVGFDPASTSVSVKGLKGDPLNLSIADAIEYDDQNLLLWSMADAKKAGKSKSKDSLAEIGHGQVPLSGSPAGVSFRELEQQSSLSFAGLRRINASAEARALVAAIGLVGHVLAFGRSMSLRSGCELRPVDARWQWRGADGDVEVAALGPDSAATLIAECVARAQSAGVALDGWSSDPLVLVPGKNLEAVIRNSYPEFEGL